MTKARDIASAAPAPSTVSATEIGYLDGVTSAIQTQIDSKIGSASAISPTLIDAKGDLIVGSAADTAARLAVGTNNHVLTADSSATNGVKWAALPSSTPTFSGCRLTKSSNQNIATSTYTSISFDGETYDTDGFHDNSTNNTRITIPSGKGGYYLFIGKPQFSYNANNIRIARFLKNGSTELEFIAFRGGVNDDPQNFTFSAIANLTAGDYVELNCLQNTGGTMTLDTPSTFYCQYLGV